MQNEAPTVQMPPWGNNWGTMMMDYRFSFYEGGSGPYTVEVYQISYTNFRPYGIEPVTTLYTVFDTDDITSISVLLPPYHKVYIEVDGEKKRFNDVYQYYVRVIDSLGSETASDKAEFY